MVPNASIIALCWNHCEDITKPFVEAILKNTNGDFELILVDNGSVDGTKKYLESLTDKRVKIIHLEKNQGFGKGNNIAYAKARGEYICFINNDVECHNPNWLNMLIEAAGEDYMVGPDLYANNSATTFKHKITPYIGGWCIVGSRVLFDKIKEDGVFDEGFGLAYFEDVELSVRAVSNGFPIKGVLGTGLVHLGSKSSDQLNINETFLKAQAYFLNKMTLYSLKKEGKKRIVFFACGARYPFVDSDYEGKGVGGAEASLILLTRSLAKIGFQVEIYNNTKISGIFNGVEYHNLSEFRVTDYCDVFILFRSFHPALHSVNAIHKLFWSCDQYTDSYGVWKKLVFPFVEKVIAISPYHRDYLISHYELEEKQVISLELGINWADYAKLPSKHPGKCIFCSVPQRGLEHMARLAPLIKEKVPEFELYITSDYRLWGLDNPDNQKFKDMLGGLEYVKFLGKIPREELVKHQLTSVIQSYPCTYSECFCISCMECIAAGAVPVTTSIAAVTTTVGDSGVLLSNTPGTNEYDTNFVDAVVQLLTNEKLRLEYQDRGRKRAANYAWTTVVHKWIDLFDQLDKSQQDGIMATCQYCQKEVKNTYLLNRHISAKHGNEKVQEVQPPETPFVVQLPEKTVIKTTIPVEVGINGHWWSGKELMVEYQYVDAVLQAIRESPNYGPDVII